MLMFQVVKIVYICLAIRVTFMTRCMHYILSSLSQNKNKKILKIKELENGFGLC